MRVNSEMEESMDQRERERGEMGEEIEGKNGQLEERMNGHQSVVY